VNLGKPRRIDAAVELLIVIGLIAITLMVCRLLTPTP
jgi:hypothetical protein